MKHSSSSELHLPDFYILDVADLVNHLKAEWIRIVQLNDDQASAWNPDIREIVLQVIDSIKQEGSAKEDLAMSAFTDIAASCHLDYVTGKPAWYNEAHLKLANLAVVFGTRLIERIRLHGIYRAGYFPYHFVDWVGDSILVQLDEVQSLTPALDLGESWSI